MIRVHPSPSVVEISRFVPVGALLDSLDEPYRARHPDVSGSPLHLFMVGVLDFFGGAGIIQAMVTPCLRNAVKRGYGLAVAEVTRRASQHIFRKLGFQEFSTCSVIQPSGFGPVA